MNTRRDIVKAGAGLAAIIASGRAPAALVRSMLGMRGGIAEEAAPTVFNYIGIKFLAYREQRNHTSLQDYRSFINGLNHQTMFQFTRVDFVNTDGLYYYYPAGMTVQTHTMFDGRKMRTKAVLPSAYQPYGDAFINRIFEHTTGKKLCVTRWTGGVNNVTDVYDLSDTTFSAPEADRPWAGSLNSTYTSEYIEGVFGANARPVPFAAVIDLSSSPLNIGVYSRWQWYTADDTASYVTGSGQRQWVEGEIVGSVDGQRWWRLDIFNNVNMPTVNYSLAYTGNLVPRRGDLWSDLDLATRNWSSGIAVDTVQ